jgi:CHAT domain-containing protein/tetratricopeptide (TPR) repeat protein
MAGRSRIGLVGSIVLVLAGVAAPVSEVHLSAGPTLTSAFFPSRPPQALSSQPGARSLGHLGSGEIDSYQIWLSEGQFLLAQVEQRGVDVTVSLMDPGGQSVVEVDSPNSSRGNEILPVVTSISGAYRIVIRALDGEEGGDYELRLVELHPATDHDRLHAQGAILLAQAERLRRQPQNQVHDAAAAIYPKAIAYLRSAGAVGEQSIALRRLSQVELARNHPQDALAALKRAFDLVRNLDDPQPKAGILSATGQVLQILGQNREARGAYEQAIDVARAGRAPLEEAAAWNNLADLYQGQGELQQALVGYDRALLGWRLNRRRQPEATVLHNLGSLYRDLGRLPEARDYLLQSLALQKTHGSAQLQTLTLTVLGQVYAWQKGYWLALSYYRRAMALARQTGNRWAQAILLVQLGSARLELGDERQARALLERAPAIFREFGDKDNLAWALANLGWLYERLGQPEAALHLYGEAAALFRPLQDRLGEAVLAFGEGRLARQRGDLKTARLKMEAALDLIESLRTDAPGPALRSSFFASYQTFYETYVNLLMELYGREPGKQWDTLALDASERTRARSFLDSLGEAQIDLLKHRDHEILQRERELLSHLDALETERLAGSHRAGLEREQRDVLLEREVLLARVRNEEERSLPPPPIPLKAWQVRRDLDEGSLLLVYYLGEKRSVLWLVDRRSVRSFVLPGRGHLEPLARAAYEALSRREGTGAQAKLVLARLANEILGPVALHLNTQRLLVVNDGALRYIPFAVLPEPGHGTPLLARHEVVYLDSPSVLAMQRQRLAGRQRAPLELAVVADPVFDAADPRVAKPVAAPAPVPAVPTEEPRRAADGPGDIGRLLESGREAAALLALVPQSRRRAVVGLEASKETVLSGVLRPYRIVHFATHGLIHPLHPELSGLMLSRVDRRGRPLDGFLPAYEFPRLRLLADLAVLSACRTALGKEIPGEGLIGMTRGLMEAGVPRLVVSLWSVEDRSTAELMRRFYQCMLDDRRPGGRLKPAAALREAQLSMLGDPRWSDPYYWAPFIFQGDWR